MYSNNGTKTKGYKMSVWTHVAGVIRVDAIRCIGEQPDFNKIFVRELWNEDTFGACNMPKGSEGSLDFRVVENPDKDSMAAYTVVVFGDLRDFGSANMQEIEDWWERVLKQCGMVRQAVLQIQPEDGDVKILEYKE